MSEMMPHTRELMTVRPEGTEGNNSQRLIDIANAFKEKRIVTPEFQRTFVWTDDKIAGWIESIVSKKAIGVIVTYQLKGGGADFLADGYQRLTATLRFIENPMRFKLDYGSSQALQYCEAFSITVQHRIYESHVEAWDAFQKLNQGTSLTLKEFYSGALALFPSGNIIEDRVPLVVSKHESSLLNKPVGKNKRKSEHILIRDSYGLFLQYISGMSEMNFWDVGTSSEGIQKLPVVEIELAGFVKKNGMDVRDIEKKITSFDKYIAESVAEIRSIMTMADIPAGTGMSSTVMRWLLHLSIWRKNTERLVPQYEALLKDMFRFMYKTYGKINSRVELPGEPKRAVSLYIGNLHGLLTICKSFNSVLYTGAEGYEGRSRSKKRGNLAPGYDNSHVLPFSENGDGETFPESGISNRSRGANVVVDVSR